MSADSSKSTYYPSLDGLRALAALMVVYGHAGYFGWVPLVAGCATIGVLLFFFLSGFLMGHHYLPVFSSGLPDKRALVYWTAFLSRRFMRVYPSYFFAPILGYLLLMPRMPPDFEEVRQFHILSIPHELVKIATFQPPQGIYWTIEVEIFFYLLYPFIVTVCLLCRNTTGVLFLLFAGLTLFKHQTPDQWAGFTSVFVAGIFTAVVVKKNRGWLDAKLKRPNALAVMSILALVLMVALISQSSPTQKSIWKFEWLFAALFFVLFTSLARSDGIISKFLSTRPFIALGRASYSLYLIHIIAYYIVVTYVVGKYQGVFLATITLLILTSLYYVLVERSFVRLGKRITETGLMKLCSKRQNIVHLDR
jgi:peptidoglycan/LPS O-acetylase OafA/YrhL